MVLRVSLPDLLDLEVLESPLESLLAKRQAGDLLQFEEPTTFDSETDMQRHYIRHALGQLDESMSVSNCSPPTPISDLESYRETADQHARILQHIVNNIQQTDLRMDTFGRAAKDYVIFHGSLPEQYCIGDSNRAAFEAMRAALDRATGIFRSGIAKFEDFFGRYVNGVEPLINDIITQANRIDASSRDFRLVSEAYVRYRNFHDNYQLNIWGLSQTIEALANRLSSAYNTLNIALNRALEQIQVNVETEAKQFSSSHVLCQKARTHWDTQDGAEGYMRYWIEYRHMTDKLIPDFNDFLQKVPNTDRITQAVKMAQQFVNDIIIMFEAFPNYGALPASTSTHPYKTYGRDGRLHGTNEMINVVREACRLHYAETGHTLYVGDLSYKHGGRAKPHSSHRLGIDADIDPVEVGNIGSDNYDQALAQAAAQRFLQAGARLIFYANRAVVNAANTWAQQQGLSGRLQYEANHTRHFHLRV